MFLAVSYRECDCIRDKMRVLRQERPICQSSLSRPEWRSQLRASCLGLPSSTVLVSIQYTVHSTHAVLPSGPIIAQGQIRAEADHALAHRNELQAVQDIEAPSDTFHSSELEGGTRDVLSLLMSTFYDDGAGHTRACDAELYCADLGPLSRSKRFGSRGPEARAMHATHERRVGLGNRVRVS